MTNLLLHISVQHRKEGRTWRAWTDDARQSAHEEKEDTRGIGRRGRSSRPGRFHQ